MEIIKNIDDIIITKIPNEWSIRFKVGEQRYALKDRYVDYESYTELFKIKNNKEAEVIGVTHKSIHDFLFDKKRRTYKQINKFQKWYFAFNLVEGKLFKIEDDKFLEAVKEIIKINTKIIKLREEIIELESRKTDIRRNANAV